MTAPRLVVIDGLDGSGKTTQIERVCGILESRGVKHRAISFPDYNNASSALVKMYLAGDFGGSPDAVNAYAASSFYAVDRYASFRQEWEKDWAEGTLIVAARYTTSNAVHQMSKLPRENWDEYLDWLEHYEYTLLGLPRPDEVIFLDMPADVAQRLVASRYDGDEGKKDIHEKDNEYLLRCCDAAVYAACRQGWHVVSCAREGKPLGQEVITGQLLEILGVCL